MVKDKFDVLLEKILSENCFGDHKIRKIINNIKEYLSRNSIDALSTRDIVELAESIVTSFVKRDQPTGASSETERNTTKEL